MVAYVFRATGQCLFGRANNIVALVQDAPTCLEQAAATVWGFVAE